MRIVRKVGTQFEDFKFIISQLRTDQRSSSPDWEFVKDSERTIQSALQVSRGSQVDDPPEDPGFAARVSVPPGLRTSSAGVAKKVLVPSSTDQAPEQEAERPTEQ